MSGAPSPLNPEGAESAEELLERLERGDQLTESEKDRCDAFLDGWEGGLKDGAIVRDINGVVVMHFDEFGELSVHVADPAGHVVVLTVDDRCPEDRVYEHTFRQEPTDVLALAPRPWGHAGDDRHGQATARVLFAQRGLREVWPEREQADGAPHNPQPQDDEG